MEPIIKETQVIRDYDNGGGHNLRSKANWALGLGILGSAAGLTALAKQGGLAGIVGPGAAPSNTTIYTGPATCTAAAFEKECNDILNVTKGMYDLYIIGQQNAAKAREIDVAEKFGLYVNNRDSIDKLSDRANAEFFSLYKYTRDKDDETNAKICALESRVAVNEAVRPYQDKIIQLAINNALGDAINYTDKKTCKMVTGTVVIPSTPTITGFGSYCCGAQTAAAAG